MKTSLFKRVLFLALVVFLCAVTTLHAQTRRPVDASALPSWNDTPAKKAIIAFVEKVTTPGSPDFVPQAERIAVFDNDGTLWPENPVPFQLAYVVDTLKQMAARKPALRKDPMVQAALAGDLARLLQGPHHEGLMHVIALTHAGMSTGEFKASVEHWLATARHSRWHKPYDQLTYQPMQEVLSFLRANGFKTFIVSGGGADFMRVWSERVYGTPPQQVVGSTARTKYELRASGPVLIKTMGYLFVDDGPGKPVGIHEFIGRRPIVAFGNSDGDMAMLEYTTINNPRPSLGVIIHHTDATREYAYDAKPKSSGKLVKALKEAPQRGWIVVDMKFDWNRVFAFGPVSNSIRHARAQNTHDEAKFNHVVRPGAPKRVGWRTDSSVSASAPGAKIEIVLRNPLITYRRPLESRATPEAVRTSPMRRLGETLPCAPGGKAITALSM